MSTPEANDMNENLRKKLLESLNLEAEAAIERLRMSLVQSISSNTSTPTPPPTESPSQNGKVSETMPSDTDESHFSSSTSPEPGFDLSSVTLSLEENEVGLVYKVQVAATDPNPHDIERIRKRIRRLLRAEFFNVKVYLMRSGPTLPEHQFDMGVIFECGHEQGTTIHLENGDYADCKQCDGRARKVRSYGGSPVRQ